MHLYKPFRLNDDKKHLMWEGVFIFQKLLVALAAVFIIHRVGKLVVLLILLLIFLITHIRVRPYQEKVVNIAEGCSLMLLILFVVVNLYWAIVYMNTDALLLWHNFHLFCDVVVVLPLIVLVVVFVVYKLCRCMGCCEPDEQDEPKQGSSKGV